MTTTTTTQAGATTAAAKITALAATEVRLVARNRTLAVSAVLVPLALGVFWALTFRAGADTWPMVVALQLGVAFGMSTYVTATQTVVARRHAGVLKRLRTSGISDVGLLVAIVAPAVALGVVQLVVFAVVDAVFGAPLPSGLPALVLAVVIGAALMVTAALATAVVTPSPERAQITTLPIVFLMLGGATAAAALPALAWTQALVALPGAGLGMLARIAFGGEVAMGAAAGTAVAAASLLVWSAIFGWFAMRRFRWDPRNG